MPRDRYDAKDVLRPILTARKRNRASDIFIGSVREVTVPVRRVPKREKEQRGVDT
jgi:hypothetical protein